MSPSSIHRYVLTSYLPALEGRLEAEKAEVVVEEPCQGQGPSNLCIVSGTEMLPHFGAPVQSVQRECWLLI